jgi:eukaryotic-like serine/threonine-protein kinase
MPLPAGHRLGPYEILAPLGAGGMGEVYKARDTRLGRLVAIKISAEQFSSRFASEARAISALNHQNICTLHDVGANYLVMELVDGDTLAAHLRKGPLPMELAIRYGAQLADALAAAHAKGIIHRDLKPANIMAIKSGIKVLDFGLAKIAQGDDTVTASHVAAGTPAYMAPEQLEGKPCDVRTDIFALGLVLYEIATGKRTSAAQGQSSLMDGLPVQFAHVVARCLEQDPENRWQSAADVRAELEWAGNSQAAQTPLPRSRGPLVWGGAALAFAGLLAFAGYTFGVLRSRASSASLSAPLTRFAIELAATDQFPIDLALPGFLGVAANGRVFYAARREGTHRLYSRGLDELAGSPVPGTEGAMMPFFSPDAKWIGFAAGGELKKAPVSGGPAETVCAAMSPTGASWGSNDSIVFAPTWNSGLLQVSARGGNPKPLTTLNTADGEITHRDPHVLPGGSGVLFTNVVRQVPRIEVVVPSSGRRRVVTEGSNPVYLAGYLVLSRGQTLLAASFDLRTLELAGPPVPVLEGIRERNFAIGADGTLAYVPLLSPLARLVWVDRQGRVTPLSEDRRAFNHPRLSPDGKRVAVNTGDESIWIYETNGGSRTRLTEKPPATRPIWTPDGKSITFAGWANGKASLYTIPADGSAEPRPLLPAPGPSLAHFPLAWSAADHTLAFSEGHPVTLRNIWVLPPGGTPKPFVATPLDERPAMFSPDGHWLVYAVRKPNREEEIYVQPYPGPGARRLISTNGGAEPVWSPTGREIFYRSIDGTRMVSVAMQTNPTFAAAQPRLLFEGKFFHHQGGFYPTYDVTRDGQQFVMVEPEQKISDNQLIVTVNWLDELKRRVPVR